MITQIIQWASRKGAMYDLLTRGWETIQGVAATFMAPGEGEGLAQYHSPPRRDESRGYAFLSFR